MPIDYAKYDPDWPAISRTIRERPRSKCEKCGVANYAVGARDHIGVWHDADAIDGMSASQGDGLWQDGYPKIIKIVLTVHHIDFDISNNDPSNLACLCQLHHFQADAQHHAANAKVTRARKQEERLAERGETRLF